MITVSLSSAFSTSEKCDYSSLQWLLPGTSILLPVQSQDDELERLQIPSLSVSGMKPLTA